MKRFFLVTTITLALLISISTVCYADDGSNELDDSQSDLGQCEHEWSEWEIEVEPTCTVEGLKDRYCTKCYKYESESIPPTGEHDWETEWHISEAKCFEPGEKYRYCKECWKEQKEIIPAIGHHTWSEWEVTSIATCDREGSREHECKICGAYQEESIPISKEHTWYDSYRNRIKYPTVFRKGLDEYYCNCGAICKKVEVSKLTPVIELNKTKLTLKKNKSKRLRVTLIARGDAVKKWKSKNKKIATVDKKGKVTAKKKGKTIITVVLKSGKKAKCKVVVR